MNKDNVDAYWQSVLAQNAQEMRTYFKQDAVIRWHNSNEEFSVEEFITANCTYPGNWQGTIERYEEGKNVTIVVVHVYSEEVSFHVTSFITYEHEKIITIDEYWGDDGQAPAWRKQLHLGKQIYK